MGVSKSLNMTHLVLVVCETTTKTDKTAHISRQNAECSDFPIVYIQLFLEKEDIENYKFWKKSKIKRSKMSRTKLLQTISLPQFKLKQFCCEKNRHA